MSLTVRRADLPGEIDRWLDFQWAHYMVDPAYVAPLRLLERRNLAPTNPFFRDAELVLFFAERAGKIVGSISALKDRKFKAENDERIAWFGYYEAEDDAEVAAELFDAALAQARAWGATEVRGPRNLSRMEFMGLSIDGFDRLPPMLQGQHKRWYAGQVEAAGFEKHHDHYAYETSLVDAHGLRRPIPEALRAKAEGCAIEGLEIRRARWRSMGADLEAAHEVLNASYASVPDVSPMPRATFLAIGRTYLTVASTELLQLAFVNGKPAGFAACLPEVNHAQAAARGTLFPMGWVRSLGAFRGERTAAFKLIGVKEEFRGTGLHAALIVNIVQGCQRAGYTRIDGSIIDERNKAMRGVVEHIGMTIWRTYRVYRKSLA